MSETQQQHEQFAQASASAPPPSAKPVHTIILDASPLLLTTPSLSTLLAHTTTLLTTHSVIAEIKDQDARTRIETLYLPFMQLRSPKPETVAFVRQFAQKTGDAAVLSKTDLEVIALAYDVEVDRNKGDWRLRKVPGQKRLNGSVPRRETTDEVDAKVDVQEEVEGDVEAVAIQLQDTKMSESSSEVNTLSTEREQTPTPQAQPQIAQPHRLEQSEQLRDDTTAHSDIQSTVLSEDLSSDSDSAEWITPSNIRKHQARDVAASTSTKSEGKTLQAATITGDFAMQNVLLQMNLNLLSPATCKRIARIKQTIFRCHGCFATTKDMSKQFCPRCGNPTLTRVSCTTNDKGEVKLHLKANMQWNNKGNVFSIPKPIAGNANQKWQGPRQGGGKDGWGSGLILAEDQKEYVRAMAGKKREGKKDLMDEDYLPAILTGDRNRSGGRIRVGAGRNVNSRKK